MTAYLIKSALSLGIILAIYQLFLVREKMPIFNRIYLLSGLLFSFLAPLITIQLGSNEWVDNRLLEQLPIFVFGMIDEPVKTYTESYLSQWEIVKIGYVLITSLFLLRFFNQLYFFFKAAARHSAIAYGGATLVLLQQQSLPYTFLHYIYIDGEAYRRGEIEEELLTHELAHVQQLHSLDIILIGLLQSLFWWNPLLLFYKHAIQLNHEFLADDAVIQRHPAVPDYQYLLLKKVSSKNYQNLSSNFNYLVTKKRLKMMTRTSSRSRAMGFAAMTIPLFLGLFLLVGNTGLAQNSNNKPTAIDFEAMKDKYFKDATIVYKTADEQKIYKAYQALSKEEKAKLLPPPPPPPIKKGEKSKKMEPLAKGTLVYITKDGKVIIDQSGEKIPPPPPPPPVHREKKSN